MLEGITLICTLFHYYDTASLCPSVMRQLGGGNKGIPRGYRGADRQVTLPCRTVAFLLVYFEDISIPKLVLRESHCGVTYWDMELAPD